LNSHSQTIRIDIGQALIFAYMNKYNKVKLPSDDVQKEETSKSR
jgi:hypothetical protein